MTNADAFILAARQVLPQFGLTGHANLKLLAQGHNVVLKVDHDQAPFVLRFQSTARPLQLGWLRSIRRDTDIRVPEPCATTDGEWFSSPVEIDGRTWRCVLLKWVAGEQLTSREFVTSKVLERIGETVARLHDHSESFDPKPGFPLSLDVTSAEHLVSAEDYKVLRAAATIVDDALAHISQLAHQHGLIHRDLAPANWVFDRDGTPGLIDFDEFGHGCYLYDLLGVLWSHASWDQYPTFREHLFAGYERIRPLPEEVKGRADAIQAATLFAWFNHGCRSTDETARTEFQKWVPSTTALIARLCKL